MIVLHHLSPIQDNNVLTWDRVVMVETLVPALDIDFTSMFVVEIEPMALKTSTTYNFSCIIFEMRRNV